MCPSFRLSLPIKQAASYFSLSFSRDLSFLPRFSPLSCSRLSLVLIPTKSPPFFFRNPPVPQEILYFAMDFFWYAFSPFSPKNFPPLSDSPLLMAGAPYVSPSWSALNSPSDLRNFFLFVFSFPLPGRFFLPSTPSPPSRAAPVVSLKTFPFCHVPPPPLFSSNGPIFFFPFGSKVCFYPFLFPSDPLLCRFFPKFPHPLRNFPRSVLPSSFPSSCMGAKPSTGFCIERFSPPDKTPFHFPSHVFLFGGFRPAVIFCAIRFLLIAFPPQ